MVCLARQMLEINAAGIIGIVRETQEGGNELEQQDRSADDRTDTVKVVHSLSPPLRLLTRSILTRRGYDPAASGAVSNSAIIANQRHA
jgi:hypothetical protein